MDVKAMLIAAAGCAGVLLLLVLLTSPDDEDDGAVRVRGRIILGSLFVGFVCAILAAGWPS
jgi:hypothetical protein